ELVRQLAREDVVRSAGRIRDDQRDGLGGPGMLRESERCGGAQQGGDEPSHWIERSSGGMRSRRRASARIDSARRTDGASTILPFTVNAPTPRAPASRAALTTCSECAISASVGRNTALASGTCDGWMQLLPR